MHNKIVCRYILIYTFPVLWNGGKNVFDSKESKSYDKEPKLIKHNYYIEH